MVSRDVYRTYAVAEMEKCHRALHATPFSSTLIVVHYVDGEDKLKGFKQDLDVSEMAKRSRNSCGLRETWCGRLRWR